MRLNLPLFFLLLISCTASAQKLTGIWRGYFSSTNTISREGPHEETYKYEIQIDQQSNNGLNGVTYSYRTALFYGKAELHGIYTPASKTMILKETKMIELKVGDKSEPCLMTCYLDYTKMGKLEILEGTFISVNIKDKGDCGNGKVYLERVTNSDFEKEDFLVKKKPGDSVKDKPVIAAKPNILPGKNDKPVTVPKPNTQSNNLSKKPLTVKPALRPSATTTQKPLNNNKPQSNNNSVAKNNPPVVKKQDQKIIAGNNNKPAIKDDKTVSTPKPFQRIPEESIDSKKQETTTIAAPQSAPPPVGKMAIPKVLVERENNLVTTVTTSEENIQIDFFDNGTIDNDTISVYHNNELVVSRGRLTYSPITIKFKCTKTDNRHEIIVVAENLGDIPPNTALMVIKAGKEGNIRYERHEITLASTEERNAKVVINYVPKQ